MPSTAFLTRPALGAVPVVLIASAWLAGPANLPWWTAYAALPQVRGALGLVQGIGLGLLLAAAFALLLLPLAWRGLLKPVLALMLVASALCTHFILTYGIVIDVGMMTNVLQTDPAEARDLLGVRLALALLVLGALPLAWLLTQRVAWAPSMRQAKLNLLAWLGSLLVLVMLAVMLMANLSDLARNHKAMRYTISPLNALWSGAVAAQAQARVPAGPPRAIGLDARPVPRGDGARPPLVVLMVGETARADRFALNGYGRPTNPELSKVPGLLSFRDATSCGTSTAESLPCMFSAFGREGHQKLAQPHENMLDVLQRAGLAVAWVDNQSGCKGLCDRVPSFRASKPIPGAPPLPDGLCRDGECLDGALLHGLDERLAALPAASRARGTVLVLHMMGSHGPAYHARSPADRKPFQPECTKAALGDCDPAALQNAYDNSIAYTDHVLAATIGWLQRQARAHEVSMFYVSDHGESLGENNLYLHGMPYAIAPRVQKHVPLLLWLDPAREHETACLRNRLDEARTHDDLFHTVMGLAGVRSAEYKRELDVVAACRPRSD